MEGFVDIEIEGGAVTEMTLLSNRGIQVMNPSRCRLNFYRDAGKGQRAFAMMAGMYSQVYQNIPVSGIFFVEPIGLANGQKVTITVNLM
jgi:hypothetical protein